MRTQNKDFIETIILILVGMAVVGCLSLTRPTEDNTYYRSAEVVKITGSTVYLQDTQGYLWTVEDDNLHLFTRYTMLMNDNNTEDTITDDIIVEIK